MSYFEQVRHERGLVNDPMVIPPDVFAYALSLKQPEALARRASPEELAGTSEATQLFIKARIIGNASVRLALESYMAAQHAAHVPFLGDLSVSTREEVLDELASQKFHGVCFSDDEVRLRLFHTKRAMYSRSDRWQAVRSYIDVRPGSFKAKQPPTGLGTNDSLLVQAFGRNRVPDASLTKEIVEPRQQLGSDEAMFRYLDAINFDEGDSNRALADAYVAILENPETIVEMIGQWEVNYSFWRSYPELFELYREGIHTVWPKSNFYPTYEVKADSIELMRQYGLYDPFELAHADMAIRALAILAKQGIQADAIALDVPFDPRSVQEQTQNKKEWVKREAPTRVHHVVTNHVRF